MIAYLGFRKAHARGRGHRLHTAKLWSGHQAYSWWAGSRKGGVVRTRSAERPTCWRELASDAPDCTHGCAATSDIVARTFGFPCRTG